MLHIHNGDSTAGMMKEAGFPGEHFAFREALAMGPTPDGLSKDEWISVRAGYLAAGNELDPDRVRRDLESLDAGLENVPHHEETILWFEHDLFCQINLAYLLDRFSRAGTGRSKLSLICVGEFPGVPDFRGLGQLTPEQMGSLFATRHEVTGAEMELARQAWAAFRSSDPQSIERLLAEDTSALPFLHDALTQHLARFPSTRNGLGRAENLLLELISDGHDNFSSLCVKFFNAAPSYGLGDSQIWSDLRRMADATSPLIRLTESPDPARASSRLHTLCSLTENGELVMAGKEDFVDENGVDMWLGGVHLHQDHLWRWDEQKQALLAAV